MDDYARFRTLHREFQRRGFLRREDLGVKRLVVRTDMVDFDGVKLHSRKAANLDPFFEKRQVRAAAAARAAAIKEYAATKGLSLAEATRLLDGKAA
jgi:primosomal protein N'